MLRKLVGSDYDEYTVTSAKVLFALIAYYSLEIIMNVNLNQIQLHYVTKHNEKCFLNSFHTYSFKNNK